VTQERIRSDANHCFVCGPTNSQGLRIEFRLDEDVCRAAFVPGEYHVGWDQTVHGGIIYCALDDVMANWLFLQGVRAHTAKCEIRYRQPVVVGTEIKLEGRLLKRKGPLAVMQGRAIRTDDSKVVADAQASFMILDHGRLE